MAAADCLANGLCGFAPAPPESAPAFFPATHTAFEWSECKCHFPDADGLLVGTQWHEPWSPGWFRVQFRNQLGLARLQPMREGRPHGPAMLVEVISQKFPSVDAHLAFLGALLGDLFARGARLPFTFEAPTTRAVTESIKPPSPLFTFHFLCQCAETFRGALNLIQAAPHRKLRDREERVPLAEATEADADVLLSILQTAEELVPARGSLARHLQGRSPARVWQRLTEDTLDTPENRFAQAFLRDVRKAAEGLARESWWPNVPPQRQRTVCEVEGMLRHATGHPMFDEVGPMVVFPAASQVLLRRDGYRELRELWQLFQHARRPLFAPLQRAVELRDIATLYEFWVFFALCEEIEGMFGEKTQIDLKLSDEHGLRWRSEARFGGNGTLVYNRGFRRPGGSYSLPLRPDFTWEVGGKAEVILDAKFGLEWERLQRAFDASEAELEVEEREEDLWQAIPERTDLYKMHTYRDALGVRAAVAVYPGHLPRFYGCDGVKRDNITLEVICRPEC